jgi:hypothetical protein
MKSIVVTYPDYQSLAKGIKKMLVVSESLFFGEAKAAPLIHRDAKPALIAVRTGRK